LLADTRDGVATFSGTVSAGMFDYAVKNGAEVSLDGTDWYLVVTGTKDPGPVPPGPTPPTPAPGILGAEVLAGVATQALGWFNQTDNLIKRMGELRLSGDNFTNPAGAQTSPAWLENVWVRSYGQQVNVNSSVAGAGIKDYQYGVDFGLDLAWHPGDGQRLFTGAFLGYGGSERELRTGFANSADSDSYYGGLYATWLHESGLYADFVGKVQHFDNHFDARDASHNQTTGDYDNWGLGLSLEVGQQFKLKDGWFIEPQFQAGYAHFTGSDYQTGGDNQFSVSISDADLVRFRLGSLFGRNIKLANGGILQPYLKISGVEQISAGGRVRDSAANEWRPTLDGLSAELGAGVIWQLDAHNQLHFEYEAAFGDKHEKPWGLTAGYRYQF
jgi:outer membrane autotransporter protein